MVSGAREEHVGAWGVCLGGASGYDSAVESDSQRAKAKMTKGRANEEGW